MAYEQPNHQYNHHPPTGPFASQQSAPSFVPADSTYAHYGPSSAPSYAHGLSHYGDRYNSYPDPTHSSAAPPTYPLPDAPPVRAYYNNDPYQDMMQPYAQSYPQETHDPQFALGMGYPAQSPVGQQPPLPMQPQGVLFSQQQAMPPQPNRGYYQRETLDKLHTHPYAQRAVMSVPSQQPTGSGPQIQPEPAPLERPANTYPFKPTVPGPLSGPVLAPEFQQSLKYSRSPASVLPSTLPAVPSTSGPSSSRQSDSTGSLSPRANHDSSLPAPIFSSTSPVTNRNDILLTDPAVKNRKYVVERDIQCIKVRRSYCAAFIMLDPCSGTFLTPEEINRLT